MLAKAATGVRNPRVRPSPSDSSLMRMIQVMAFGCGLTTASKPLPDDLQAVLGGDVGGPVDPGLTLDPGLRFLWRKLSSHHRPSPIRRTAAHSGPVSREVFTPLVLASPDLGFHTRRSPRRAPAPERRRVLSRGG